MEVALAVGLKVANTSATAKTTRQMEPVIEKLRAFSRSRESAKHALSGLLRRHDYWHADWRTGMAGVYLFHSASLGLDTA